MTTPSHRLRREETKIIHKLIFTLVSFTLLFFVGIFIGLPILAKFITLLSPGGRNGNITANSTTSILFPPTLDPLPEATNSSKIVVSGLGDKDTSVRIYVNNKQVATALVDKDGKFSARGISLEEGVNTITAATLFQDKESTTSSPSTISYKKNPPKLDIGSPKNRDKFSDSRQIVISGQTDPGNRLYINDRLAIVDQNGTFGYPISLSDGENTIKIAVADNAGNENKTEIKVTFSP